MTAPSIPLCRGLLDFLNLFARAAGTLYIDARSSDGIGHERPGFPLHAAPLIELPMGLYPLLEDPTWGFQFTPVLDGAVMPVAAVVIELRAELRNGPRGHDWYVSQDRAAAVESLDTFAVRPTAVVDASPKNVAAFWALTEPVPADARAAELLRRLAEYFGETPPADPLALRAPLPGGLVREVSSSRLAVDFRALEPERLVTITDLEAALTAPRKRGAKA